MAAASFACIVPVDDAGTKTDNRGAGATTPKITGVATVPMTLVPVLVTVEPASTAQFPVASVPKGGA